MVFNFGVICKIIVLVCCIISFCTIIFTGISSVFVAAIGWLIAGIMSGTGLLLEKQLQLQN